MSLQVGWGSLLLGSYLSDYHCHAHCSLMSIQTVVRLQSNFESLCCDYPRISWFVSPITALDRFAIYFFFFFLFLPSACYYPRERACLQHFSVVCLVLCLLSFGRFLSRVVSLLVCCVKTCCLLCLGVVLLVSYGCRRCLERHKPILCYGLCAASGEGLTVMRRIRSPTGRFTHAQSLVVVVRWFSNVSRSESFIHPPLPPPLIATDFSMRRKGKAIVFRACLSCQEGGPFFGVAIHIYLYIFTYIMQV